MVYTLKTTDFDGVRLKLASPEQVLDWSHGEVLKPETINYRTQKPEKEGLFCERIFGPSKDWECYCGKYKKIRYKGITCDKCGVEVTRAIVRRERMGHISLAIPVSHIWYLRGVPSKIGLVLDVSMQNLEKVIYFANFIITSVDQDAKAELRDQLKREYKTQKKKILADFDKRLQDAENIEKKAEKEQAIKIFEEEKDLEMDALDADFKATDKELKNLDEKAIISESEYKEMSLRYGHLFRAGIGAEAIRELLEKINLETEVAELEEELEDATGAKRKKLIKRVRLLKGFKLNNIRPEWMVLQELPVIPPDLRPMVPLDGGRFATSDLNDLYRRVINRNNRLKRLQDLNAPEVICRNEKRMLQEAVDALIDNNARRTKTTTASTGQKRQLKSLADILKGKQGRFRQNLLGKRIDYSGRSVIVVGPTLNMGECGIPKRMALELFKPFIISKLIEREFVHNIRSANRFIDTDRAEVWDILEEVVADAFVLLNRAPTLHRLGIQAFRPVLIEGKSIQLHPLVCSAFNADFDGDQMAVHVPLTEEARREAAEIMHSTRNLLKPATGKPIANPSHDMSWGVYYITRMLNVEGEQKKHLFSSINEAKMAYGLDRITIYEPITVKMPLVKDGKDEVVETTLGRIMFNEVLPEEFEFINETITKKDIGSIIFRILENFDFQTTSKYIDKIKHLGFKYVTKSGYSWGMADLPELTEKYDLVAEGNKKEEEVRQQFEMGLLTKDEKHSKIVEIWTSVKDKVTKLSQGCLDERSSVYSMIMSGSRGSWGQLTQMVGMKGLVSNPSGEIIELPVKSNFKEGFEVLEYFISTHGTRKGLADTALRTANAGYLTRRLVDVAQDVVINDIDCGDDVGTFITKELSEKFGQSVVERVAGRFTLAPIVDAKGKELVPANTLVTAEIAAGLEAHDLDNVHVRSVLSCKLLRGVCQKCYGLDLASNREVKLGTAVGIIAAQSIGEPGTQLTMRTFHTGGVASAADITQGLPRVEELFEARTPKFKAFMAEHDGVVTITEQPKELKDEKGNIIISTTYGQKIVSLAYQAEEFDVYKVKKDYEIKVKEGDKVIMGDILLIDPDGHKIKAKRDGEVIFDKKKLKVRMVVDKVAEYTIPQGYVLWVKDGDTVKMGDQLTEGALDLKELFKLRDKKAVEEYVTSEIQHIYSSQGQKLNDKHIELIIKQLFSRVYLRDPGQTDLLPGEIVEKSEALEANIRAEEAGLEPATYDELFLGVSKVSLSTRSFLSAASFQETSKVLINASVTGRIDKLEGLKENVIIGRLIPAGTGFDHDKFAEPTATEEVTEEAESEEVVEEEV